MATLRVQGTPGDYSYQVVESDGRVREHGTFADPRDMSEVIADHNDITLVANRAYEGSIHEANWRISNREDWAPTISSVARSHYIECPPLQG